MDTLFLQNRTAIPNHSLCHHLLSHIISALWQTVWQANLDPQSAISHPLPSTLATSQSRKITKLRNKYYSLLPLPLVHTYKHAHKNTHTHAHTHKHKHTFGGHILSRSPHRRYTGVVTVDSLSGSQKGV
jgi:hypothetical protein